MATNPAGESTDDLAIGPRNGVYAADGYGLRIAVERGHLIVDDGYGRQRRRARFAKVGHGLRRLLILGHSGSISLEALRWLDKLDIQLLHLDRDGRTITASASLSLDDARLRRAQAVAGDTHIGNTIVAKLMQHKLAGQRDVARTELKNDVAAEQIGDLIVRLDGESTLEQIRSIEAVAATIYFGAWVGNVTIRWATKDDTGIPDHWRVFQARRSPLSIGASIRAADPINAQLNYLYALAESECRRACQVLGLDPGLGLLHVDNKARDSMALDLIETIRPDVERWLLQALRRRVYRRDDFTELDDGHCRVAPPLTQILAQTMDEWRAHVAPWAELVAHQLAEISPYKIRKATPLTSASRRGAQERRHSSTDAETRRDSAPQGRDVSVSPTCRDCGAALPRTSTAYCAECWPARRESGRRRATAAASVLTRDPGHRERWSAAISSSKRTGEDARLGLLGWHRNDWEDRLWPAVREFPLAEISKATGLSTTSASRIKTGRQTPRAAHWDALGRLAGVLPARPS